MPDNFGAEFGIGFFGGLPLQTPNVRFTQPYTYDITIPPVNTPVSLALVKEHLKIELINVLQDSYLTLLIEASTDFFQKYTNRVLITTEFQTFFDCFRQSFELARSRLIGLVSFEYLSDGSFIPVDSTIFYTTKEADYSRIIISDIQDFPTDKDDQFQSIRVKFTAGFGAVNTDIPSDIKIALLNQIASMYENRGDCNNCDCGDISNLPIATQNTYRQYRIISLYGSPYRG